MKRNFLLVILSIVMSQVSFGQTPELVVQTGNTEQVRSVAFNRKGRLLAAGSRREVKLWDVTTRRELRTISSPGFKGDVRVSFTPAGDLITLEPGKSVKYWDVATGKELKTSGKALDFLFYSLNGKIAVLVDYQTITLQDALNRQNILEIKENSPILSATISPDGEQLAFIVDKEIKVWNVGRREEIRRISGFDTPVSVNFSPDGFSLAIGSAEGVDILNLTNNQKIRLPEYRGLTWSVAFSPDGKFLAGGVYGVGDDVSPKIWDLGNGNKMTSLANPAAVLTAVAFSFDGKSIAVGDRRANIRVLDLEKGRIRQLKGHSSRIKTLIFSPDGNLLGSAGSYGTDIKLWDLRTGREVSFTKLPDWAESLPVFEKSFGSAIINGREVSASPGTEKVLKFFNVIDQREEEIASLILGEGDDWLVTTPAGFFDGTPNGWKQIIWRLNNNTFEYAPVERYFKNFFYPNLLRDVFAGRFPKPKA